MFYSFDTEDKNGKVTLLIFYNGTTYHVFTKTKKAIAFLDQIKIRVKIYCVNVEYDLLNLFGEEELIRNVKLVFSKSKLLAGKYKKVSFVDTLNHWKLSVAKMGEIIGVPKLKLDPNDIEYCKRDCFITWEYTNKMLREYEKINMTARLTIGSTALNYFLQKFNTVKLKKLSKKTLEYYKNYYYGGRTECFKIGRFQTEKNDIHCIDINSLYAFCMTKMYPNPYKCSKVKNIPYGQLYIVYCKVKSDLDIPVLPKRINNRLCFPNGIFNGYYTNIEIEYFIEQGGKILKVYECYKFPIGLRPFKKYVDVIFKKRLKAKNVYESETYKLLGNTLYGKWAQGNEVPEICDIETYLSDPESYRSAKPILNNEYIIATKIIDYPRHTNYIYSLFVTAYGRVELHKLLTKVKNDGNILLYTDTDSVIYIGKDYEQVENKELGGFKKEFSTTEIHIKNLKEYYYLENGDFHFKIKGMPKNNNSLLKEYFAGQEVTINKPIKLRQSLRGRKFKGKANIWMDQTKRSAGVYEKGIVKNNQVYPFILQETT